MESAIEEALNKIIPEGVKVYTTDEKALVKINTEELPGSKLIAVINIMRTAEYLFKKIKVDEGIQLEFEKIT